MEIAPQRIDCNHPMMPDYKCLQVREIRYDDSGVKQPPGEWEAFYGDIEGFEFCAGERKVLRLKKFDKPDPVPAVASPVAYVLDMVVESALVKYGYVRWIEPHATTIICLKHGARFRFALLSLLNTPSRCCTAPAQSF